MAKATSSTGSAAALQNKIQGTLNQYNPAQNLINTASSHVGETNRGQFIVSPGTAWCAGFTSTCMKEAGIDTSWMTSKTYVPTIKNDAVSSGRFVSTSNLQAGDLIFFDWNQNGTPDHVGIVAGFDGDYILTYEGNTGTSEGVALLKRSKSCVVGGARLGPGGKSLDGSSGAVIPSTSSSYTANQSSGGAYSESTAYSRLYETTKYTQLYETSEYTQAVMAGRIGTVDDNVKFERTKSTSLLSYPSLVETPFVIVTIGNYTFGTYTKEKINSQTVRVDYPNYITSLDIVKVNGSVNTYTIGLTYQIEAGNNPNLLDEIFSSVGYGKIKLTYGDWSSPTFIYKEEEALITKITSNVDFSSGRILYTISCTSTAVSLAGMSCNFAAGTYKPSDLIYKLLYSNNYGLTDVFYGMANESQVRLRNLIATDDRQVQLEAKTGISPISYINYLVTCMCSQTSDSKSALRDSSYYMTIVDDAYSDLGGPYFTVKKVSANTQTLYSYDTYEVDIGYPGDNLVSNFQILTDNSWALVYKYSEQINKQNYVYSLDDDGKLLTEYSPNITTSSKYFTTTEPQRAWWTTMTKFPITATLTIKGLLRPAMLMTYVKINALFYGQRHISSGLYIITRQQDSISGGGYRTVLTLTRVAGDNDYVMSLDMLGNQQIFRNTSTNINNTQTTTISNSTINNSNNTNSTVVKGNQTRPAETKQKNYLPSKSPVWETAKLNMTTGQKSGSLTTTVDIPNVGTTSKNTSSQNPTVATVSITSTSQLQNDLKKRAHTGTWYTKQDFVKK